jgi:hypothetical protein
VRNLADWPFPGNVVSRMDTQTYAKSATPGYHSSPVDSATLKSLESGFNTRSSGSRPFLTFGVHDKSMTILLEWRAKPTRTYKVLLVKT